MMRSKGPVIHLSLLSDILDADDLSAHEHQLVHPVVLNGVVEGLLLLLCLLSGHLPDVGADALVDAPRVPWELVYHPEVFALVDHGAGDVPHYSFQLEVLADGL